MTNESEDVYEQVGGARIGRSYLISWNYTSPFAHFTVSVRKVVLVVSVFGFKRKYEIERDQIKSIKIFRGLISKGIQVEHILPGYPPCLIFWPTNPSELQTKLQTYGFQIDCK